ncbi:TcpQ domain-containing protein [uncultured Pseudomonas sp.]|uniref:PFGI-1 class ICE element type IV pilus protein PilL2 n=1 Tax=uncultured Pseudomonas sp. TaxID=114707 RepID=UPI0025FDC1CA|nr:TcpQ domain-containing protein [uncultured Pseudomonas sp.]
MTWKLYTLPPLALAAALAGCATPDTAPPAAGPDSSRNPELLQPDLYPKGAVSEPQVRYGRYTLVNTAPETEQRDLMAQIIDVSIPASMKPSVRDAMQYVVNRSGYSLCGPEQGHVNILYTRPLPATQYKLGPMSLRNTLQVLAGPAWQVKVDEVMRSVCFVLRPGYQLPESPRLAALPARTPAPAPTTTPAAETATSSGVAPTLPLQVQGASASATKAAAPVTGSGATARPTPEHHRATPAKDGPSTSPTVARTATPAAATRHPARSVHPAPTPSTAKPSAVADTTASGTTTYGQPSFRLSEPASAMGESWDAPVGSTLRQSVEAWAKRAGWQVIWDADDLDYPIEAALHFRGTFAEAIAQIFPLYDSARRSFIVDGNSSQRIVHVSERKKS